ERPSGRATPSLRDAPGDAPIQIDAVPKLIVAPQGTVQ
ncbi:plasmid pRiA4b ORF-3 family protein, partial [Sinorhizobium meliloti]